METEKIDRAIRSVIKAKKHLDVLDAFLCGLLDEKAFEHAHEIRSASEQLEIVTPDWIDEIQKEMLWRLTQVGRKHRFVRDGVVWVPWTPSMAAEWKVFKKSGIPVHRLPEVMYRDHPAIQWTQDLPDPNRPEMNCRWCGITVGAA